MQRNTQTIAADLKVGDRFYKKGDAKKIIMQLHEKSLSNIIVVQPDIAPELQERTSKKIKNDTQVIFLRNIFEEEGGE